MQYIPPKPPQIEIIQIQAQTNPVKSITEPKVLFEGAGRRSRRGKAW